MSDQTFAFLIFFFVAYEAVVFIGVSIAMLCESPSVPQDVEIGPESRRETVAVVACVGAFLALLAAIFVVGS